jgi:hypothetical protein
MANTFAAMAGSYLITASTSLTGAMRRSSAVTFQITAGNGGSLSAAFKISSVGKADTASGICCILHLNVCIYDSGTKALDLSCYRKIPGFSLGSWTGQEIVLARLAWEGTVWRVV